MRYPIHYFVTINVDGVSGSNHLVFVSNKPPAGFVADEEFCKVDCLLNFPGSFSRFVG